ncbi:hypothetical protein SAMN05216390_1435 [Lachnospiraceae bacterium KH1T2]|nr:hypothetical protein SAMN05216390_1435 [Lachnospiraceae bacterium KH1T2]
MKKMYDHKGICYKSMAEMLRAYGLTKTQYYNRIEKGWDIEHILTTPKQNTEVVDHLGNKFTSLKNMCNHYGIAEDTFKRRYNLRRWTLEESLTRSVKRLGGVVDPYGKQYKTITEMCRAFGISEKTYRSRVGKLRWNMLRALETETRNIVRGPYYDHMGEMFKTMDEMCKKWNTSVSTYSNKLKAGYSVKDALTLHVSNYQTSFPEQVLFFYCKKIFGDAMSREIITSGNENMEIDVYIPSKRMGIEFDCSKWHSYKRDEKKYRVCRNENIYLIRITDNIHIDDGNTCDKVIHYKPKHKSTKDSYLELEKVMNELFILLDIRCDVNIGRDDQKIYKQLHQYAVDCSLARNYPDFVKKYWDYSRNIISPYDISSHSNDHHWFIVNGISNKRIVNNALQTYIKTGKLFNPKMNGYNTNYKSLAELFPDFVDSYWDYSKNDIDPYYVKPYSNIDVYLIVEGISETRNLNTSVRTFARGGKLKRFVSLIEKYPNWVKDHWVYELNDIEPTEIGYGSHKEVYLVFDGKIILTPLFHRNHSMKD